MILINFAKIKVLIWLHSREIWKRLNAGYAEDTRFWKYSRNEKNISSNIIRFLPISYVDLVGVEEGKYNEVDLTPMAKILRHQFQGPTGQWYIQNSLQTFGEECPISEWSRPQWAALKNLNKEDPVVKAKREALKKYIPSTEYIANILVIKDGTNPQNNGKVFLFKFGEAIRKLIEKANNPKFEDQIKIDPFDVWEGANLILNLEFEERNFGKGPVWVPKFDGEGVRWAPQSVLCDGNEEEIEKIWKQSYSILEFYDRSKYPTYESAKERFYKIMGLSEDGSPKSPGSSIGKDAAEFLQNNQSAPTPSVASVQEIQPSAPANDDLSYFESLLNGG